MTSTVGTAVPSYSLMLQQSKEQNTQSVVMRQQNSHVGALVQKQG
jgi:hypothetical protein